MFPVHVNDGTTDIPNDDICYIVAKEGVFLKKKVGIMESIAPVDNISILESVDSMARMNIKKIPGGQFARVIAFFRAVYAEYYGEAIVLLFYDEEKRVYKIVPPHQKVTAAACDYNKGITIDSMQMIGTIHSHANMSAFHSGTDDSDEEHFDGLHITIGNMKDEDVSITASIVANGHRFVINPEDYVERLVKTVDIDKVENRPLRRVFKWKHGKVVEDIVAGKQSSYSYRTLDKRFTVKVSDKYHRVIPQWMEMVEKGTYTYKYAGRSGGVTYPGYPGYGYGGYGGYGGHYDADLWKQAGFVPPQSKPAVIKPSALPDTKPGNVIKFPMHKVEVTDSEDDEVIPCQTCVFRGHKFLAEEAGEDYEPEIYICKQCETVVVDGTESIDMPLCPICKTDDHLMPLDEEDLPKNYISELEQSHLKKEPGLKEDTEYLTCNTCGNSFHIFAGETICPFCYSLIEEEDIKGVNTEEERISQLEIDTGAFLDTESEEANALAIEETIIKIPDPSEPQIPITEIHVDPRYDGSLMSKFRRVFGGKDGRL